MVNTPIPASLKSEANKAAKILREFTDGSGIGLNNTIPAGLLLKARGLAVLTVVKIGFLVTARGGSGIVIARRKSKGWSAPSAIGIAGLGGGFEIGAEVTDFVIILTSQAAIEAFSKGGNLTLGGNFTVAAGPVGRNFEGDVAVKSLSAIYTYSKTRGLFAGISLEGSVLLERKETNAKFYGRPIRAKEILGDDVVSPPQCSALYDVLAEQEEAAQKIIMEKAKYEALKEGEKLAINSRLTDRQDSKGSSLKILRRKDSEGNLETNTTQQSQKRKTSAPSVSIGAGALSRSLSQSYTKQPDESPTKPLKPQRPPPAGGRTDDSGSASALTMRDVWGPTPTHRDPAVAAKMWKDPWASSGNWSSGENLHTNLSADCFTPLNGLSTWGAEGIYRYLRRSWSEDYMSQVDWSSARDGAGVVNSGGSSHGVRAAEFRVRALYDYQATLPCDLTFRTGDVIEVLTHTDTWTDWWEGRLNGHVAIFPANFTEVI